MSFPEPDEDNEPNSPYDSLVEHATRIVLLSIQMLMLHHFDAEDYEIWHDSDLTINQVHVENRSSGPHPQPLSQRAFAKRLQRRRGAGKDFKVPLPGRGI